MNLAASEFLFFFDSAKGGSNDDAIFFKLRFITTPALFWENKTCWKAPSQKDFIECTWLFVENSTYQNLKKIPCDFEDSLQFLKYLEK